MGSICQCIVLGPPAPVCDANCIYAPDMLISDSVTACDLLGEIDISPIVTKCGTNTKSYKILSSKNITGTPTITSSKITFVPANNNYAPGEIVYKVSCGMLSASGKIIIVYKNECTGVNCAVTEKCNKCTGNCEDLPGSITTIAPGSNGFVLNVPNGGINVI